MDKEKRNFFIWSGVLVLVAVWTANYQEIMARVRAARVSAAESKEVQPLFVIERSTLLSCESNADCEGMEKNETKCTAVSRCVNNLCVLECPAGIAETAGESGNI